MKLAIMQPYFFPYIGYFQAIKAVDKYILYENLDYITQGWMHRNRILVKNQKTVYINVKLVGKSSNKKINEIELVQNYIWKKKLINSIDLNYRGSLFFDDVFPLIKNLIEHEEKYLFIYNSNIINKICEFLDIKTTIETKNNNYLYLENALDNLAETNYLSQPDLLKTNPIKKVSRVIKICQKEKATTFINAIGGLQLYSKEEFKDYGIDLLFIESKPYQYNQFSDTFHPHLSIIDVLMHNGKEGTKHLINNYILI
jgi:hypothetical protein